MAILRCGVDLTSEPVREACAPRTGRRSGHRRVGDGRIFAHPSAEQPHSAHPSLDVTQKLASRQIHLHRPLLEGRGRDEDFSPPPSRRTRRVSRRAIDDPALLPQADRRQPQIGVPCLVVLAAVDRHEDPGQILRVVPDPHLAP